MDDSMSYVVREKQHYNEKQVLLERIYRLEEKYERAMENAKILSDAVTKLERERDAAVEMLRRSSHCCESCKHMPISECVCTSEPKADGSCWEWRGLPEV